MACAEQVDARGVRVGQQQHVGLVDGLESTNRRAVKSQAVSNTLWSKNEGRNREVLHDTGQVAEPDVDKFDVLVLGEFEDVVGRLIRHRLLL